MAPRSHLIEDSERAALYQNFPGSSNTNTIRDRRLTSVCRKPIPYLVAMILLLFGYFATHREGDHRAGSGVVDSQKSLVSNPHESLDEALYEPFFEKLDPDIDAEEISEGTSAIGNEKEDEKDNRPDKAIVLSSFKDQNVGWLNDLPSGWRIYRYLMDDSSLPPAELLLSNKTTSSLANEKTYTVPRNQGREAMAYLTFIIDHYHNLPLFTIFLHGHDRAWHQIEHATHKVRALNLSAVAQDQYNTIRCGNHNRCDDNKICDLTQGANGVPFDHGRKNLPAFWKLLFPREPLPTRLAATQGAQFAVTRQAIRSRPLELWRSLRRPLERDSIEYAHLMPGIDKKGGYQYGLLFEHIWHVLFGKKQYHCPDIEDCRSRVFSGAISCDRHVDLKEETEGWENVECRVDQEAMQRADEEQERAVTAARENIG